MSRQLFLLLILLVLISACGRGTPTPEFLEVKVESPLLDRVYSGGGGPRSQIEVQPLDRFPEALWLTAIELRAERPDLLEKVTVRFVYPERHYRRLGLDQSSPVLAEFQAPGQLLPPSGRAVPLRSNEPLIVEARWRYSDPYGKPVKTNCKLKLHFKSDDSYFTPPQPARPLVSDGTVVWEPESTFKGWPESLR